MSSQVSSETYEVRITCTCKNEAYKLTGTYVEREDKPLEIRGFKYLTAECTKCGLNHTYLVKRKDKR